MKKPRFAPRPGHLKELNLVLAEALPNVCFIDRHQIFDVSHWFSIFSFGSQNFFHLFKGQVLSFS